MNPPRNSRFMVSSSRQLASCSRCCLAVLSGQAMVCASILGSPPIHSSSRSERSAFSADLLWMSRGASRTGAVAGSGVGVGSGTFSVGGAVGADVSSSVAAGMGAEALAGDSVGAGVWSCPPQAASAAHSASSDMSVVKVVFSISASPRLRPF